MHLASEVPPDVLSSGVTPVAFSTELPLTRRSRLGRKEGFT